MSNHTAGPWEWLNYPDGRKLLVAPSRAVIHCPDAPITIIEPDQQLIAASPDLIECLTEGNGKNTPDFLDWIADRLVYVHGENPNVDFVLALRRKVEKMRAAVAKATGDR